MSRHSAPPTDVTIAYTEGCEHTPATRVLVEQAAKELGLAIEVRMVLVTTEEEAVRYKVHGSPTVLVNGQDADPAMRGRKDYGFT